MRIGLYILMISVGCSCILSKKKDAPPKNQISFKNRTVVLGDTAFNRKKAKCQYIVEDISTYLDLPDSLKSKTYSQSPEVGDTIHFSFDPKITLYFEQDNKIDTFYYRVKLDCDISFIPQFISGCGISDVWEIPDLINYPNNTVKVFNRWGNLVFEEKGYYTGWNGTTNRNIPDSTGMTKNNIMLPVGTYFYIIDLKDSINDYYTGYLYIKR